MLNPVGGMAQSGDVAIPFARELVIPGEGVEAKVLVEGVQELLVVQNFVDSLVDFVAAALELARSHGAIVRFDGEYFVASPFT